MLIKKVLIWFLGLIAMAAFLTFMIIGPIDRTPIEDQPSYKEMMSNLDSINPMKVSGKLQASWSKINITPSYSMPMAGYVRRTRFDSVHDSLFARIILLQAGSQPFALINIDLLLFPPLLKERLNEKLSQSMPKVFLYLSATHTHNGIGGWDDSLAGKLALGNYDDEWVDRTADQIVQSLLSQKMLPASMVYWESDASDLVVNRIAYDDGNKDGKLRGLIINRADSTRACLFVFSAHSTSITKRSLALSTDYPGRFIKHLESEFDFGMYMAGMVGSHNFRESNLLDFELIEERSALLADKFSMRSESKKMDSITVSTAHIPISFSPSQLRIGENLKTRSWVFNALLNPLKGELTYLKLGNITMIGTPCDFSGEISVSEGLQTLADDRGTKLIITSFNGDYIGYITYDGHYDSIVNDEVRIMNWVGPYYGDYFADMIRKLLIKS